MDNIEDSYLYQSWLYSQYEPEEKLFVGRKPPREPKGWMMKSAPRDEPTEEETLKMENAFLNKHGIDFK